MTGLCPRVAKAPILPDPFPNTDDCAGKGDFFYARTPEASQVGRYPNTRVEDA